MLSIHTPVGKKRRIPLTPLIDVIFILVMFFLLSSTFGIWRPLDVSLGGEEVVASEESTQPAPTLAVLVILKPGPDPDNPVLIVNGLRVPVESLAQELDRLAGVGATSAVLIPDANSDFQQVVRVLDEAKTSRIGRVSLKLN
ncbi:biopolymer transporter ExbD [uncultured Roseibium sp.]|uniref:ExbD/TolR family protein n=1 Tax=uncultured Roseibium sp. TaxID=1936171 RepID=UPI0026126120|nr:biopolymer transporter ExbD [uncultured Roseibium sp.]